MQAPKVVFEAGGSGKKQGLNLNANAHENVPVPLGVSNRFSGLVGDGELHETGGEMVVIEEDKENVSSQNGVRQGQERLPGNGIVAAGRKALDGGKKLTVELEKRNGGLKQGKQPRGKLVKSNAPTRGLVFGPGRGEVLGISSGKRLRVENESVGRAGGVYIAGSDGLRDTGSQAQGNEVMTTTGTGSSGVDGTSMDLVLQEDRSGQHVVDGDK
ncbi:unnamed protein product [Arabidopsis arenosa]|uniref:Uncharacterized protein n=1 Tax=Arabidopsis arenosa TaxID=38785 RepID=A0A8S1ZQX6_ARAAE|nr:unnamed protein product [Arabidopsis arenosa]